MSYTAQITSLNPSLWYKCDEASGNLIDSGSYGLDLAQNGTGALYQQSPDFVIEPGVVSLAGSPTVFFDGVANPAITTVDGALVMWVETPDISGLGYDPVLFHLGDNATVGRPGIYLRMNSSRNYRIEYYDNTNTFRGVVFSGYAAPTDVSENVIVSWEGNPVSFTLYVNGDSYTETVAGTNIPQTPTGQHWVRIGSLKGGTTSVEFQWPGRFSQISYHEAPFTAQEALDTYIAGIGGIPTAPFFTLQPVDQTVTEGGTATFTIVGEGNPDPTIQWYKVQAQELFGETSASLSFTAELEDSGQYYAGLENINGVAYSQPARLTVNPLLTALTVQDLEQAHGIEPLPLGSFEEYPDNFPCPNWNYAQTGDLFHERTGFDSGWTRQRRRWQDNLYVVDMEFEMDTQMFHDWSTWIETYGREFFLMDFDQAGVFLTAQPIRFISDIAWRYIEHDRIIANVSAEFKYG